MPRHRSSTGLKLGQYLQDQVDYNNGEGTGDLTSSYDVYGQNHAVMGSQSGTDILGFEDTGKKQDTVNSAQDVEVDSGVAGSSEVSDDPYGIKAAMEAYNTAATQSAKDQMDFNHKEAELQRQWQETMSNTAHQREVADLEAAGINKLLTLGGNGASTPSGGVASAQQRPVTDAGISGITQIATQTMRDIQSVLDRELNALQFDKSLSFEERKFKEQQIQNYIGMGVNAFTSILGIVSGNAVSTANSLRNLDAATRGYTQTTTYGHGKYTTSRYYD